MKTVLYCLANLFVMTFCSYRVLAFNKKYIEELRKAQTFLRPNGDFSNTYLPDLEIYCAYFESANFNDAILERCTFKKIGEGITLE